MKAKPVVLQPRQRTNGHRPDAALDMAIAAHQRKHMARLNMFGIDPSALLGRRLSTPTTTTSRRL